MAATTTTAANSLLHGAAATTTTTTNHRLRHPQSLSFRKPTSNSPLKLTHLKTFSPKKPSMLCFSSNPNFLAFYPDPNPQPFRNLFIALSLSRISQIPHLITSNLESFPRFITIPNNFNSFSQTLTLIPLLLAQLINTLINKLASLSQNPTAQMLKIKAFELIMALKQSILCSAGTAYRNGPDQAMITAVATGIAKWLDIYSGVLMVRILLSWFPNMPWEMQPFSAIRDLCDPYLSLFRSVLPPVWNVDLSPLLAFGVLNILAAVLNTSPKAL